MRNRAAVIILSSATITILLWLLSVSALPSTSRSPLNYASQITANLTVVFMGMSLLMSMRMQLLEKICGGLDKNYKFHALVGSLAFVFMVMHPLTLAINKLLIAHPTFTAALDAALFYVIPGQRIAANFGIAALYLVLFAFTFMTYLKIPYNHWLTTHRLLGIAFLLAAIHAYLAPSHLIRSAPLAIWIGFWIYAGLASSIYSIVLYRMFGPHHSYTITKIEKKGDICNLHLQPRKEKMTFVPGQFMYIRFRNKHAGSEMHPFSASSDPDDDILRFSIKGLGDFTKQIDTMLAEGERAEVYGPYGHFGHTFKTEHSPMIWIGGGVGITPFLSMIHAEARKPSNRPILLYYSLNKVEEAVFQDEIATVTRPLSHLHYVRWIADEQGFLTADTILSTFNSKFPDRSSAPNDLKILLCGPPGMMHALHDGLRKKNLPEKNIIFEEFSFVS